MELCTQGHRGLDGIVRKSDIQCFQLVKLVRVETCTTLLCILIEYRHRFLSYFLHSTQSRYSLPSSSSFSSSSSNGIAYRLILEQLPYDLLKITVGNEKIPIVRNGFSMNNCRFGSMVIFSSLSGNILRLSVTFLLPLFTEISRSFSLFPLSFSDVFFVSHR